MRARELIRQVCPQHEREALQGHVSKDYVHPFVSISPQVTATALCNRMNGRHSYKLLQEYQQLPQPDSARHV